MILGNNAGAEGHALAQRNQDSVSWQYTVGDDGYINH